MGAYVAPDDVRAVLGYKDASGLYSDPASAASLSDSDINQAIAEAQAQVDSALTVRYFTPFDHRPDGRTPTYTFPDGTTHNVPWLVFQVTRDIAAYKATLVFYRSQPLPATHPIYLRYRDVVGTQAAPGVLDRLRTGSMSLAVDMSGLESSPGDQPDQGGEVYVVNPTDPNGVLNSNAPSRMFKPEDYGLTQDPDGSVHLPRPIW